jgi:hypothetical protein
MSYLRIWLLSVASAVCYGVLHDQVTTRISIEYFTIGHPPVFSTTNPTWLAFGWGFLATWWVGLLLGIPFSLSARVGNWPKLSAKQLVWPVLVLLMAMAVISVAGGLVGRSLALEGKVRLPPRLGTIVPPERQAAFMTAWWAHSAAYQAGFLGGLVLCIATGVRRWQQAQSIRSPARG